MKTQRGTVRRITFEIEYPDGSTKQRIFDGSDGFDVGDIHAIIFNESFVRGGEESSFTVSAEDWEQNPTMVVYYKLADSDDIGSFWPCRYKGDPCM